MSIKLGTLEVPDVDTDDEFMYASTLAIDPPLSGSELKKIVGADYVTTKQVKDEDVKLVDGQIVVVSENVTQFLAAYDHAVSGIERLYANMETIGNAAGRELQGDIIVSFMGEAWPVILRLTITSGGRVVPEIARLYWPVTGTTSPMPKGLA